MRLALLSLMVFTALVIVPGAAPKEGAQAVLTSTVPLGAKAGSTVDIAWTVTVPDETRRRRPFNAIGMFVRLLSRTGAPSTIGFATPTAHEDGRYDARIAVPQGGIGGVRAGLRGSTDVVFPVVNDPFARCDAEAVRAVLRSFTRAFNTGDAKRLDRLFSRTNFVWYSSAAPGRRTLSGAADRSTLAEYFRARHRRHDRVKLLTFRLNGYDETRRLGHFELTAERRADDYRNGSPFELTGKGALDCAKPARTFAVLTLGGPR
jgi:hypothetical protein